MSETLHPEAASKREGPADQYFKSNNCKDWDIIDYLKSNEGSSIEVLLGSWWRALRKCSGESREAKRAAELLAAKDHDSTRVRDWNRQTRAGTGQVNIQNSTVNGFSFSIVQKTKKRARSPRSSRGGKKRVKLDQSCAQEKRLASFQARLRRLDKDKLWFLKPGKDSVEHRLGQYVLANNHLESPAHSLIVDTGDDDIRALFDDDEWGMITGAVKKLPEPDIILQTYLELFLNKSTVDDLKDILEQGAYHTVSAESLNGPQRRKKYPSLAWSHLALSCLECDYRTGNIALRDNREKWYQTHIWTPLFDRLFECITNVRYLSGECPTNATSSRRNPKGKSPGIRMNPGCLHDGVIKFCDYEIGAVENGGCNIGPGHAKWTSDTLKVVKSGRDMIVRLISRFGDSGAHTSTLGIVTGGLCFKTIRMNYGGGSACVLVHDSDIHLPTTIQHFGPIAECLVRMWQIKEMTEQATRAITSLLNIPYLAPRGTTKLLGSIDTAGETSADEVSDEE